MKNNDDINGGYANDGSRARRLTARTRLTKETHIKRVAPPYINFETCGDYLIIASQNSPDAVKLAYYEGKEIKEGEVVRNSAFRWLVVEIDDSLKAPEILLRAVAPKPVFYYRMSQKEYATMPCLPKPEKKY